MTAKERALQYHADGCNCCQSVLCALGEYTQLPTETAASLGYGFGGGMLCGNVCGAVTGGLMALGCACTEGKAPADEKPEAVRLARAFEDSFSAEMGSLLCKEIIAANGRAICEKCIAFAAETAENMIREQKK